MTDLRGKVAVVLGASAEAGTGWAIAEALAEAGVKVVVGARSAKPLQTLAERIQGLAMVCDAGNEQQVEALLHGAIEHYGRLDIAVNASGLPVMSLIADCSNDQLAAAINVNYMANVHFVKYAAREMTDGGSIVIISSLSTTHPVFPNFPYACAKAATDCLVRYAAMEFGPRGIRVNSILPAGIVSDLSKVLFANPEVMKRFASEVPMGRVGYPKDFANAVLWLAGPAYVTGLNLPVCGGNQLTRFPFTRELPGGDSAWEGAGITLFDQKIAESDSGSANTKE